MAKKCRKTCLKSFDLILIDVSQYKIQCLNVYNAQVPYSLAVVIPSFNPGLGHGLIPGMGTVLCLSISSHYAAIHSSTSITWFSNRQHSSTNSTQYYFDLYI